METSEQSTQVAAPVVILPEAMQIRELMSSLQSMRDKITDDAWKAKSHTAMNLGRLAQQLDATADMLFDTLNTAASRCKCTASAEAIEGWLNR